MAHREGSRAVGRRVGGGADGLEPRQQKMYMCMYVCMYVYICLYTTCIRKGIYIYIHIVRENEHAYRHTWSYVLCTYTICRSLVYHIMYRCHFTLRVPLPIYMYIYIYTYICIYIYICMRVFLSLYIYMIG